MSFPLYIGNSFSRQEIPVDGKMVTPSDTNDILGNVLNGGNPLINGSFNIPYGTLYIGSGGTLSVMMYTYIGHYTITKNPVSLTVKNGKFLKILVAQVLSSGTTASHIVALY